MRFIFRKRISFGPLYVNLGKRGFTSWGFRAFGITKNVTRGTTTVNTPGPGAVQFGGRRRGRS